MQGSALLITNNKALCQNVRNGHFVDGTSLDVLIAVRDKVHLGSCLLTHPLCGNLRPYQQPFRSVIIQENPGALVDLDSLSFMENAVEVYKSCEERLISPEDLTENSRADYAFLDGELMKDSLELYGLLSHVSVLVPAPLNKIE